MPSLLADLRYGLRLLVKTPAFTFVTLLVLALGVGATTAVFSVLNAVTLRPLPYPSAERIVLPWRQAPKSLGLGYDEIPWGIDDFHHITSDLKAFDNVTAFKPESFNFTGVGEPAYLEGVRVSSQFFRVLGVQPTLGRSFTAQEDTPDHDRVAVLSFSLWKARFNGDNAVLGQAVNLNGQSYTVVGVMPTGFSFPRGEEMPGSFRFSQRPQIWIPLALPAVRPPNYPDELAVAARLKNSVTVPQVQAEMKLFRARMESLDPSSKGWYESRATSLTSQVTGNSKTPLLLALAAVGIVLLIACFNIASLLLARSLSRGTEFAVRAALGAGSGRLIRQLLSESLLLALFGGAAGIGIAELLIGLIKALGPPGVPRLQEVGLDRSVLAFAFVTTLASAAFFGLTPALVIRKQDLSKSLREGGRSRAGSSTGSRIRNGLLIFQVALSLILVIASGLFTQTFLRLQKVDAGFQPDRVLTFALSLPVSKYQGNDVVKLYQKVLSQLRSVPGVDFAGLTSTVPMDGATDGIAINIPGRPAQKNENLFANYTIASQGYFSAVRTPLLRGRAFDATDTGTSYPVAVINQSMAQRFWPGVDPIGKQLSPGDPRAPRLTIVGVVANVKRLSHREEPSPEMYVPFTQSPFPSMQLMHFVLRGNATPASLSGSVRQAIQSVDPSLPIVNLTALQSIVDSALVPQHFSMLLLVAFAALSLLLASCGLYGAISYSVGQRTREIGIRLALGVEGQKVIRMVLGQGARLAGLGIAAGLTAAVGLTHLIASFLYGVSPNDPLTFFGVSALLMSTTLLASYLPARRASRIDPVTALRQE